MKNDSKQKTISYSALSTYLQCPLKYKLHYIDGRKATYTTDALLLGNTIHLALDFCMKQFKDTGRLMGCMELRDFYAQVLKDELKRTVVKYKEGWHREKLLRFGQNMVSSWRAALSTDMLSIGEVIAVEKRFKLDAIDPLTGKLLPYKITGVIDLILKLKNWPKGTPASKSNGKHYPGIKAWLLIDHKTSGQVYDKLKIDRDLQLTLYQHAALKMGLIPDRERTLVAFSVLKKTIRPDFNLHISRRTGAEEIRLLKLISWVTTNIDLENFYPNFNPISCKSCPWVNESECLAW